MFKRSEQANLVKSFREGDRNAFQQIYNIYNPRIFFFLPSIVGDHGVAQKLTEQDFFAVWTHRRSIKSPEHLKGLLYYFARLCGARYLEGQSCTVDQLQLPPMQDVLAVLRDVEVLEMRERILEEIEKLSLQQKTILELRFISKPEVPAIAGLLNRSPQTIRNTIATSMRYLTLRLGMQINTGSLRDYFQ